LKARIWSCSPSRKRWSRPRRVRPPVIRWRLTVGYGGQISWMAMETAVSWRRVRVARSKSPMAIVEARLRSAAVQAGVAAAAREWRRARRALQEAGSSGMEARKETVTEVEVVEAPDGVGEEGMVGRGPGRSRSGPRRGRRRRGTGPGQRAWWGEPQQRCTWLLPCEYVEEGCPPLTEVVRRRWRFIR